MLHATWFRYAIAVIYFFFTVFLFLLPGSAFPKETWFSKIIWFDKLVHAGLFFVLVLLYCWAGKVVKRKTLFIILVAAIIYGLMVEIVQESFVRNRSFDWGDLLADTLGSLMSIISWHLYKKIDPCRNRGRNQN